MEHILKLEQVKKYYGGAAGNITKAVDGISMEVNKGEFTAIMGASGSGKTTLLNCISTIDTVTAGHITVNHQDITKIKEKDFASFRRKNLGFIFQDFNLLDTLTIEENISLSLIINKANPSSIERRVHAIADKLGIRDILSKFPYEVSGGQKQRCACARALINEPNLILADEPTGALDSRSSRLLLETMSDINRKMHTTILMVTHDPFSASFCERILFLKDGKLFNEIFKGEKSRKEFGTYMLLGIKKTSIARLLVTENILVGIFAFILAIPIGFVFSQFISVIIVKLLKIPKTIFIFVNFVSIGMLAVYFLLIYLLVLLNLLRRIRKMTVHDFLYFEKQNETKMFHGNRKRNILFLLSIILGIAALALWASRWTLEKNGAQETLTYLIISMSILIVSMYGICATCADMLLSALLKSKKIKYKKDYLFTARTFASKARTMSFTFGTLSMLILLSLLCLNYSSICKGVYHRSIELTAPYDVDIFDYEQPFDDFNEYLRVIDEDYTINESIEFNIYKDPAHQIQNYYDVQFYNFDPVMKLSDYNKLLKMRSLTPIELKSDEYFLVTDRQLLYKVEGNNEIQNIRFADQKLHLKGIDTNSFWYTMNNTGRFTVIVPDKYVSGLEISEKHLIADTKEDTTSKLEEKIKTDLNHLLVTKNDDNETIREYYRVNVRGTAVEEQNTMTAMIASLCLYIAFILISAVGTILAIQSLSDSAKYKYRYTTLQRLGVNDSSIFRTIRRQLLIFFFVPVICPVIAGFCMLASMNNVYHIMLESRYTYLLYFISGLAIFFFIYGIYWITAYIGFKRNINEES